MSIVSFSRVKAYQNCPWLYKLLYIDRKYPPLSPYSSLGMSLHKALELYHRNNATRLEEIRDCYIDAWVHEGFNSAVEQVEFYEKGWGILQKYWQKDQSRHSEVVWVEKEFAFNWQGQKIQGIIDRVDRRSNGDIELIDYKLSAKRQEQSPDLQIWMYGFALEKALNLAPKILSVFYLDTLEKVSLDYHPAHAEGLLKNALEISLKMIPPYTPNTKHCPQCAFRKSCRYSSQKT